MPAVLHAELGPLSTMIETLSVEIAAADQRIAAVVAQDPIVRHLTSAPGIGPVTATAFVATLDTVQRFARAEHVAAYLGLVPREQSSGERQQRGRITKAGNGRMRWLLVEAAWRILRSVDPETAERRAWATRVVARRGRRIAIVALARRLAVILYAMWRDHAAFDGRRAVRAAPSLTQAA